MRKRKHIKDRDRLNFEEEPVANSLADTTSLPQVKFPVTAELKSIEDKSREKYKQNWVCIRTFNK